MQRRQHALGFFLFFMIVAASPPARGQAISDRASELFSRALVAVSSQNYAAARSDLERALEAAPPYDARRVLYAERLGYVLSRQKDWSGAEIAYTDAIQAATTLSLRDPIVGEAFAGMGLALAEENKIGYAERFLKKSLEFSPTEETRLLVQQKLKEIKAVTQPPSNFHFSLENNLQYYDNTLSGSNRSASFLTPGHFAVDDLSLRQNYLSTATAAFWETSVDGRRSDDVRVESRQFPSGMTGVERYTLKRLVSRFGNAQNEGIIGDYLASFTPYTLGTSLKGIRYNRKLGANADVTVLFGGPKANWDQLWSHYLTENVDRKFYGARVAERIGGGTLGASAVWSQDSRARFNTTAVRDWQKTFGADWSLPSFRNLALHGESAYAETRRDNPTRPLSAQNGWAHLVKAEYFYKRFSTVDVFERVSPGYATNGGAATPDNIRVQTQNQYRFRGPFSLIGNYTWFHNNLAHAAGAATLTTALPEGGVRYVGRDWRPSLAVDVKVRYRLVTTSTGGLRDRTRSISTRISDRYGIVDATLEYEFQAQDKSDASTNTYHHNLGLGASASYKTKDGIVLTPNLRWNLQQDRDNVLLLTNQTGIVAASLGANFPNGVTANAGYSRTLTLNAANPSADRRSLNGTVGFNILKNPDYHFEANLSQNDNRFSTPYHDFKETVGQFTLSVKFPLSNGSARLYQMGQPMIFGIEPKVDLEAAARTTMAELSDAYSHKRHSDFMRLVSDDFQGNVMTLEDALDKDFQNYRSVNLIYTVDRVNTAGDQAGVAFHYNMAIIDGQGNNNNFNGQAEYFFKMEKGQARLLKMTGPIIFGNSLPQEQNPIGVSQDTPVSAAAPARNSVVGAPGMSKIR